MSYTRRNTTDGSTVMNKDLYDNLQDGIEERGITPEMFGAVGDGIHDDTEAIQSALDNSKYNTIYFKGTYLLSKAIKVPLNKTLIGLKGNKLICKGEDNPSFAQLELKCGILVQGDHVSLIGLNIEGTITWHKRTDITSSADYSSYWDNRSNGRIGICLSSVKFCKIDSCSVTKTTYGVLVQYCDNITVESCYVHHTMTDGVAIYHGSSNVKVIRCCCEYCNDDSFPVYSSKESTDVQCENIVVAECISKFNPARGFLNHGGKNVIFVDNTSYKDRNAFYVDGQSTNYDVFSPIHTKIISNHIYFGKNEVHPNNQPVIYVSDSTDTIIKANSIEYIEQDFDNVLRQWCLYAVKSFHIKFVDNYVEVLGLTIISSSSDIDISHNTFESVIYKIIQIVDSTHSLVAYNSSFNTKYATKLKGVTVAGNSLTVADVQFLFNNFDVSIHGWGVSELTISSNEDISYFPSCVVDIIGIKSYTSIPAMTGNTSYKLKQGVTIFLVSDKKLYYSDGEQLVSLS